MKAGTGERHLLEVESVGELLGTAPCDETLDVRSIHDRHADFVWLTLQRFGVHQADLEDMAQEVFVVVHRRIGSFDRRAKITTWLYGICLRVASGYRRRNRSRPEEPTERVPELAGEDDGPEAALARDEARRIVDEALDSLDLDKRAIFVMFEIDELSCDEIADIVGIPVGTVYSRLHAARATFRAAVTRLAARARGGRR
jgi:RNA polymerase sigma-70 factor (ECF subfamily)